MSGKSIGLLVCVLLVAWAGIAAADLDGHGPDAWRVTGIADGDVLNARSGPGTSYAVIDRFEADERGMRQVTCVPYLTTARYVAMSEAERAALPPRWCLMRSADLARAGWVAQRYITPDDAVPMETPQVDAGADRVEAAAELVRRLYRAQARADRGQGPDPLASAVAAEYFSTALVASMHAKALHSHPLYGAQDFDGEVVRVEPDPQQPMFRGMITINVDFTNFGREQRAVVLLRSDPARADAAVRIFRVQHADWTFPEPN